MALQAFQKNTSHGNSRGEKLGGEREALNGLSAKSYQLARGCDKSMPLPVRETNGDQPSREATLDPAVGGRSRGTRASGIGPAVARS